MKNVFDVQLDKANRQIVQANDSELFSDDFEKIVRIRCLVEVPYLDKEKTSVEIKQEVISMHNAPLGVSFVPGAPMDVAVFKVPIVGDLAMFNDLFPNSYGGNQSRQYSERFFVHKEYSKTPISGNAEVINAIKEKAKAIIERVQLALDEYKRIADEFNDGKLKSSIDECVEAERNKRKQKKDTENNLNPFG